MLLSLPDLYTICTLSSGRRILIYQQMQPVAVRLADTVLVDHIGRGLEHDWTTHELDMRWLGSTQSTGLYGREVKGTKHEVDRLLTGICDVAMVHLSTTRSTDPRWGSCLARRRVL